MERLGLVLSLGLTVTAAACGSILQEPPDGGPDGGLVPCRQLAETACRSRNDCAVGFCSLCGGAPQYAGCYNPATEVGPVCAAIACPAPCSILDEASCKARTDCRADACVNCNGGSGFIRCAEPNDPPVGCPPIACPLTCAQMATRDACEARGDCHPVFVDGRDCQCAALGCCARFSRCADGAAAVCKEPPITCDAVAPHCEGPYVVAYSGGCFEGCVLSSDCAAVSSP